MIISDETMGHETEQWPGVKCMQIMNEHQEKFLNSKNSYLLKSITKGSGSLPFNEYIQAEQPFIRNTLIWI